MIFFKQYLITIIFIVISVRSMPAAIENPDINILSLISCCKGILNTCAGFQNKLEDKNLSNDAIKSNLTNKDSLLKIDVDLMLFYVGKETNVPEHSGSPKLSAEYKTNLRKLFDGTKSPSTESPSSRLIEFTGDIEESDEDNKSDESDEDNKSDGVVSTQELRLRVGNNVAQAYKKFVIGLNNQSNETNNHISTFCEAELKQNKYRDFLKNVFEV